MPSESQLLLEAGDEASLRKAVELDPKNVDAAFALAQLLLPRAATPTARWSSSRNAPGNFRADGLAARIELERRARRRSVADAFATLDAGELEDGPRRARRAARRQERRRRRIRRVIVAILDELGVEHPLARETRRKLAAALY